MFKNDDDMVECPYNKSHLMLRKRLQPHLLKCRIHYPNVELMKCPFNATHLVPEPEFTHHVTNCPGRKLITQYKYDAPEQKVEATPFHKPVQSDENWDDTDVPDYDPTKYTETANIIRKPEGPTPSERKEFIKKERKRLGDEDTDDDDDDGGNDDNVQAVPVLVPECQNNETRHHEYDRNERSRSRSPRSRSPNERNSPASSSHRGRGHRDRSPPTPPSPPIISGSSYREKRSYNQTYYTQNTDKASSSNSRPERHNTGNDSYSNHDRDTRHDNSARNPVYSRPSPGSRSYTNNYKQRD